MECFCFHALLRLCVSLHFRLISWKPSLKWTPSKAISCLGPLGVRFRQFSLQSTLIIQFQQASNCSKLTVNTRKRCEICSNLTITTYQNDVIDIVLVSLLLALNIFCNLFYCFYCWLWGPHYICLEQISIGKRPKYFKASGFPCCILNNTHFFWNRSRQSKKFHHLKKSGDVSKQNGIPRRHLFMMRIIYSRLQNYSLCCRKTKRYV